MIKHVKVSQDSIIFALITCLNFILFLGNIHSIEQKFYDLQFDCCVFFERTLNYIPN